MSFSRSMLKGMGLTDEQVDAIIEEHAAAKDNLKVKIKSLEEQLKDSEEIRNKYNDLADDVKKNNWKDKFDNLSKEFKEYKEEIENSRIQESKKESSIAEEINEMYPPLEEIEEPDLIEISPQEIAEQLALAEKETEQEENKISEPVEETEEPPFEEVSIDEPPFEEIPVEEPIEDDADDAESDPETKDQLGFDIF